MKHSKIHLESAPESWSRFHGAASIHSHTLCSRETLSFIDKLAHGCRPIRVALQRGRAKYKQANGSELDLARAWWTPPAAPHDAWLLERNQIQDRLGLQALVSLTDHDTIEAPMSLRVLDECSHLPISVEWTVPFGPTFFHLGVHNIPSESVRELMDQMRVLTVSRSTLNLQSLLEALSRPPESLVVFNHPCWDESGIGQEGHDEWAARFASQYRPYLHAFEINGLRPWPENRKALQMAQDFGKPIISGGDRHALEPNAILDLTNASTFGEYVEQVRSGHTDLLLTRQYRDPFQLRILQGLDEIMQDHDNHGRGWRRWSDRVFYRCDDGIVRSMTALFANHVPGSVQIFIKGLSLMRNHSVRQTFRYAFSQEKELAL